MKRLNNTLGALNNLHLKLQGSLDFDFDFVP